MCVDECHVLRGLEGHGGKRSAMLFALLMTLAIVTPFSSELSAQVVDPVTAAQAPVPGAGHNYIGAGAETLNPADGTVTFNLPLALPAERGMSFAFGIRYDESSPFYLGNNGSSGSFNWTTPAVQGTPAPFDISGWSYALPAYEAQAFVAGSVANTSGCGDPEGNPCNGEATTNYCWASQNYNFHGLDGGSHALYVANKWPDPGNPQLAITTLCESTPHAGFGGYAAGGAVGLTTTLGTLTGNVGPSVQPPLTVTDRNGVTYQFPQGPSIAASPTGGGAAAFGSLAQTITDRNGNQIVLNGNGLYASNQLAAGSYTDTLGRSILAWSGLGSSAGDQLTISGLGKNIVVQWTTTSVSFPTNIQVIIPNSVGSPCSLISNSTPISVVSEIDLPNKQKYSFSYGGTWGRLSQITFPDGGYIRYVWGTNVASRATYQQWNLNVYGATGVQNCWAIVDTPAITDRYVSFDGSTEVLHQHFAYSTNWNTNDPNQVFWTSKKAVVTSTDNVSGQSAVTTYTYSPVAPHLGPNDYSWQGLQIPVEQSVVYQDGSSNTLKTVNKTWFDQYTMIGDQTILSNGQGMTTLRCPDSDDRVLAMYEYNFQSAGPAPTDPSCVALSSATTGVTLSTGLNVAAIGPLLRQTTTVYHAFSETNILDDPDSVTVAGNPVAQTNYLYDGSAVMPSGAQTGLVAPVGSRGNVTSVSRWLNTSNSFVTTTFRYFDTGNIQSMVDPCGNTSCTDLSGSSHATTFTYADKYTSLSGETNAPYVPPAVTAAFATGITDALGHTRSFTFDYNNSQLTSATDPNLEKAQYFYQDSLNRLTLTVYPDGGQTSLFYNDPVLYNDPVPSVTSAKLMSSNQTETSVVTLDRMGHLIQTKLSSDPEGPVYTDTIYDGRGNVYQIGNPTRCSSSPGTMPSSCTEGTWGFTTMNYDALGRKTLLIHPGGASESWYYSGNVTTFTNENGNSWQQTADAIGRLATVVEPGSLITNYVYDSLNNLSTVNQAGLSRDAPRNRSFTYDSLSRLIAAGNPEAASLAVPPSLSCAGAYGANWTACYGYDANGNLSSKTDNRSIITSYSYDALNRLMSKTYFNDPACTPWSYYQYDSASSQNGIGRLTSEWTQRASAGNCYSTGGFLTKRTITAYDPTGRLWNEQQSTLASVANGNVYAPAYTYDLVGNLLTSTDGTTPSPTTNPSVPVTFTNTYDSAEHLVSLTSNWADPAPPVIHPETIFSVPASTTSPPCANSITAPYTPFGSLANATYGSGLTLNRAYDLRLRITCENDVGSNAATTSGTATVTVTGSEQSTQ
jgi:YD repeat-containing protein